MTTFTPLPINNVRLIQEGGYFWIEQVSTVSRMGRSDAYADQLADTEPIGEEDWNRMKPYVDLNEAIVDVVGMMLDDNYQLRDIDLTGVDSDTIARAEALLQQVSI